MPSIRATSLVCLSAALVACTPTENNDTAAGDPTTAAGTTTGEGSTGATTDPVTDGGGGSTTGDDSTGTTGEPVPPEPAVLIPIDHVTFYDGYAQTVDEPVPEGIIRHSNALVATRLTDDMLAQIQTTLKLGVVVGAACDNYDRIGGVNLALVPKGAATYTPGDVERIEVARFITPFMNMNKSPNQVPYEYEVSNLIPILKDPEILAANDLWIELMIFGVPYAAQKEVSGCAGRIDTQIGTLLLQTDSTAPAPVFNTLLPIAISEDFNNYAMGASDEVGTTRKTRSFTLDADAPNLQLVLITSNHGANQGGEEYIRRQHYVYIDGVQVLQYRPGRTSCEPFRKYNTQGNGIYGPSPRSDAEWQSFSNWCPGDVIDTRIIPLKNVPAGTHEFVIDVPDATFADMQGNFPFSLYVQVE